MKKIVIELGCVGVIVVLSWIVSEIEERQSIENEIRTKLHNQFPTVEGKEFEKMYKKVRKNFWMSYKRTCKEIKEQYC